MSKKKKRLAKRSANHRAAADKPLLSLCVIARDEADYLDACLASVEGLVDEIIVVDTGSKDGTKLVARQRGARVFDEVWQDDFSRARNRALNEARGEWVLVLDCDEVIAPSDHAPLRKLIQAGGRNAYRMTTRNYSTATHHAGWTPSSGAYAEERTYDGWFPSTKVRLWRQRGDVCFEGVVHELVEPSLMRVGVEVGDCPVPVHHYGYVEKAREKGHYVRAGERKVLANPRDVRAQYELAIAYRDAGENESALERIDAAIASLATADAADLIYVQEELVHLVRADILTRLGRRTEALQGYDALLLRYPDAHQALNNRGILLEQEGRIDEARASYQRAVELVPDNALLRENLERVSHSVSLSICIVARDQEALLERCLQSVCAMADQVIVIDTGSSDVNVALAGRYGAKLERIVWQDDLAAVRNTALEQATGDWVFWLDADEHLLAEDMEKVRQIARSKPDRALYCTCVRGGAVEERVQQIRMMPNRPDLRFEMPAFSSVTDSLRRASLASYPTDIEVHCHRVFDPAAAAQKRARNAARMDEWLRGHSEDWQRQIRFGQMLYANGVRDVAGVFFASVRAGDLRVEPHSLRLLARVMLGRCLLESGAYEEAQRVLEEALELEPEDALALFSMGDVAVKLGHYADAERYLRASLVGRPTPDMVQDALSVEYATHFFLGQALSGQGRNEAAVECFEAACRTAPDRTEARQAIALLRQGIGQGDSGLYMQPVSPALDMNASNAEADASFPGSRLTLCMIVRNEEARLGRCLESVRGVVDEIVVVDTGSEDTTVEVAKSYGARVGFFEWCDDFSAARNASLQMATGDWIMWLDADDILPPESHGPIRQRVEGARDRGYFFVLDDQGYEQISCLQLRLFPNRSGVQFEMPVHEQVAPSLTRLGLDLVQSEIRVQHTGYTTPEVVAAKKERYLGIMERWVAAHPADYMERSHVALTYYSTNRLAEAERAYRYILEETSCYVDRNWVIYTTALLFLGRTYMKMGRLDDALSYMQKAEAVDRDYILTQLSLAEVHAKLEVHDKVIQHARAVVESERQMTFFPIDYEEVTFSANLLMAQSQQALADWDAAAQSYRRAASTSVLRRSDALGGLFNMHKARGQLALARAALEEALEIAPNNADHLFNLGVLELERKEWAAAERFFGRSLELRPDFTLALLNLGFIAKSQGRLDEAELLYKRAIECDVDGIEARANLAHLYVDQERFSEAADLFESVREVDGDLLDIELGYLLSLVNLPNQDWPRCQSALVQLKKLLGDWTATEADFMRTDSAALRMGELGALLLGRELTKCAERALSVAIALNGELLDVRRLLAEVHFALGKHWAAIAQLEAVLTVEPTDTASFGRLGDCYAQLGVNEAAQMCYARAGSAS